MRLATPSGDVTVSSRSWPLAGLDFPRNVSNARSVIDLAPLPGGEIQSATYAQVYRCNPWVFAGVEAYARALSRLPFYVYEIASDGSRQRVRSDVPQRGRNSAARDLDYLFRFPEPGVEIQEHVRKLVRERWIYGNAFETKERDGAGRVRELRHVPWSRVSVQEGEDVPILWYEIHPRNGGFAGDDVKRVSPLDAIHHGRSGDVDSPVGLSPLAPLKFTLKLHDAIWRHATAYFENSARPSGNVQLQPGTKPDVIEKVREQIRALYTAPENAGKVLVTTGEWQSMADAPNESQIIELARLSREEIAAAFGIPQPMMGILDRAILNNVKELRNYFTRDSVGPFADEFEGDYRAQLIEAEPVWRGLDGAFYLDEMLRPDLEARADVYEKTRHVFTPNEMRGQEGLPRLDDPAADTIWLPAGSIPADSSAAPAPAPAPSPSSDPNAQNDGSNDAPTADA